MARLIPISGLAEKAPACFLLEAGGARLVLDLGEGPPPGRVPDVAAIGRADALLLSHQHKDHCGALALASRIGDPEIFATDIVARALPDQALASPLPLRGATRVCGIEVRCGRSGHAPGGVWMHLGIGEGLLYMGDNCASSILYAFDPPPPAATVILDASFAAYDAPLDAAARALDAVADAGPLLLPAPPRGRGPELALHFARRGRLPALDEATRSAIRALAGPQAASVLPAAVDELRHLAAVAPPVPTGPDGVIIVAPATADDGAAKRLVAAWRDDERLQIIMTGYSQPGSLAERLVKEGRAQVIRWNIHPRLSENLALARAVGASTVIPAFGAYDTFPAARLATDGPVEL